MTLMLRDLDSAAGLTVESFKQRCMKNEIFLGVIFILKMRFKDYKSIFEWFHEMYWLKH